MVYKVNKTACVVCFDISRLCSVIYTNEDFLFQLPFFDDANVACLKSLDDLYQMDNLARSKFYRNLPNAIKNLPPVGSSCLLFN